MESAVQKRVLRGTVLVALFGGGLLLASSSQSGGTASASRTRASSGMSVADASARAPKRNRADPSQHRRIDLREHAEQVAVTYDFFGKPHPKPTGQ